MNWMLRIVSSCLLASVMFATPNTASACPSCREALASDDAGPQEPTINQLPAAYNLSIYMMVGMCYSLLGGVGFMVYRGVKKNEAYISAMREQQAATKA